MLTTRSFTQAAAVLSLSAATAQAEPAPVAPPSAPQIEGARGKEKRVKKNSCREDKARLCAQSRGREATRTCMLSHAAELAPACRAKIEKAEAAKKDCEADAARLCAEVKPGHGRTMACLIGRKADVAPACRKHVDADIARFKAHKAKHD